MSIADDVNSWFGQQKLAQVFPDGGRLVRRLYLAVPIYDRLLGVGPSTLRTQQRWTELGVEVHDFVHGETLRIPSKEQPRPRTDPSNIKLLAPCGDQVWELRSNDSPRIRIFGRFRAQDEFVGLVWRYRLQLGTPEKWAATRRECVRAWDELHLGTPLTGDYPNAYLTRTRFVS